MTDQNPVSGPAKVHNVENFGFASDPLICLRLSFYLASSDLNVKDVDFNQSFRMVSG